jgi:cytochrome c5
MNTKHFPTAMGALALVGAVSVACGDAPTTGDPAASTQASALGGEGVYTWWRIQRTFRQAAFDGYMLENVTAFESFKNTALGNLGVPMIMLRLFPDVFPDIWGKPEEHFAPVGFAADPYEPWRALPLGLGYAASTPAIPTPFGNVNINVVTLTCMACHGGRVIGSDGVLHTIPGAPNTQFDGFRTAVYRTVNDPRYTVDNFLAALSTKPIGWLYNDPTKLLQEIEERAIFTAPPPMPGQPPPAQQFLTNLQQGSNFGAARWQATLGTYTYRNTPVPPNPGGPTPGYLDAIGAGIALVVDPTQMTPDQVKAAVPPLPAMIDIMSVWAQDERPMAQWDGSIPDHVHRNLAAEFGVVGDPAHLSMENVDLTTPFTDKMPSAPYPFDVDVSAAARGQSLFNEYCSSCHTAGNATIFPPANVGTDANRAIIWTPFTVGALRQVLRAACTDPVTCNPGGVPIPDSQIVTPTGGYMALPLDGIWARAPYLHNGAVPTLAALLTGERPATFWRGNVTYDEANVGFTWDRAVTPYAAPYDTTLSGNSNVGHDTAQFLGDVDWKNEPGKLHDMLEYLKTL